MITSTPPSPRRSNKSAATSSSVLVSPASNARASCVAVSSHASTPLISTHRSLSQLSCVVAEASAAGIAKSPPEVAGTESRGEDPVAYAVRSARARSASETDAARSPAFICSAILAALLLTGWTFEEGSRGPCGDLRAESFGARPRPGGANGTSEPNSHPPSVPVSVCTQLCVPAGSWTSCSVTSSLHAASNSFRCWSDTGPSSRSSAAFFLLMKSLASAWPLFLARSGSRPYCASSAHFAAAAFASRTSCATVRNARSDASASASGNSVSPPVILTTACRNLSSATRTSGGGASGDAGHIALASEEVAWYLPLPLTPLPLFALPDAIDASSAPRRATNNASTSTFASAPPSRDRSSPESLGGGLFDPGRDVPDTPSPP